jgi:hypothetical protein
MISYIAALGASAVGWQLGQALGPVTALFIATFAAAGALYATRRFLHDYFDS